MCIAILIGYLYLLMEGLQTFTAFWFFVLIWIFSCQSFFLQAIEKFCLYICNYGILNNARFISLFIYEKCYFSF